MLKNYFKVAWRNLLKNKVSSFINIAGLAVGMTVAILIGLWAWDEFSFDRSFDHYDRIAQVMQNQTFDGEVRTRGGEAMQLGPELASSYGHDLKYVVMSSWTENNTLSFGDKHLRKSGNYMSPEAPDMLSLKMLKGTRAGLKEPGSILLSESVARSIFGNADPMEQLIQLDNKLDVKVTGVYADLPYNSSFYRLGFIAPWALKIKSEGWDKTLGWGNSWFQTFVQIADHADMDAVSAGIRDAKLKRIDSKEALLKPTLFLHPMSRWHLYSEFKNGQRVGGRIQYVWLFCLIGLIVLLLACINFMNLSTARSEKRAREVGIRKAIGSLRSQLIWQFYTESILVACFSFILALGLVRLMLPFFNELADKRMSLPWENGYFWMMGIGFSLFTGLVSGSYPALYLSSFNPVKVLKGGFRVGRLAAIPRKALVVVQFTVSVTLIICTIVVFRQIEFARDRPIGYDRSGLLYIPIKGQEMRSHYELFRNELLSSGAAQEVAQSESTATNAGITNGGFIWKGKNPNMQDEIVTLGITQDFGKAVDWQIAQGRDFSKSLATDTFGMVLNETAVKYMGLKDPIGETVQAFGNTYHVIGVVKDMVMQSPYDPVRQTIFYIDIYHFSNTGYINVKLDARMSASNALAKIESIFARYNPAVPFEYKFADTEFDEQFRSEQRIGQLASGFAILAIFISSLGLFGMASFVSEQRFKEIGVRKVLGATVFDVLTLLSMDFVILISISLLIAMPLAYYFMHSWLMNYQYRSSIAWWVFAVTALGSLLITLLTVGYQAIKAALMDPVKSLRTE
jgi:ABC-type antimicrobial peptide transport system permease subunit